ncbi:MAG: ABC transporter ATP-binding protein [Alteromonadaceae bacterium]|nr:ABC transporter ATP-binding protein [Alteromonadaceae bacterium]
MSMIYEVKRRFRRRREEATLTSNEVMALKDINFAAYSGESVGILGRNGSGKSTLMNIMAGSLQPSTGEVFVSEMPTLLSVSAALQGHLTGDQNARLGLLAKGVAPAQVEDLVVQIGEWADLGAAMGRPFKTYSSGMKARLKFAIATAIPTEVLMIDEALGTGDSAFAIRAKKRMDEFLGKSGTVFLVSHSAASIRKHCKRAIWLNDGEIIADGAVSDISPEYERWNKARAVEDIKRASEIVEAVKADYLKPKFLLDSEVAKLVERTRGLAL